MYASQLYSTPRFLDDYPAGISITTADRSSAFVYVNAAFCQLTQYSSRELVGASPKMLHGPLTDPAVLADLRSAMLVRQPWHGSTVNYRRDGSAFRMEWMVFPIYDDHDRLINWGAIQHGMALDAETRTEHFARQPDRLSNSYFEFLAAYEHTLTQLAMELHDNVGQQLLELTRRLATAAERAQRSPVLRHELAELNELALDLSVQLRHVMHKARPQALSDFGVYNAVEDLARRLRKSCGIVFTVQCMGEKRRLPAEVETNLYRILQEAMSNIVKHSDARVANVSFFFLEQAVEIVVSDDGRGLPPEPERTPGIGLRSMVHRAEGIGAELRVSAPPNQGTTLHIVLPTGTRSPQEPVQPNPASVGPAAQPRPFPQKAPAERDASSALPVRRRQR